MVKAKVKSVKKKRSTSITTKVSSPKVKKILQLHNMVFPAKCILFIAVIFISYRYDFESDSMPYQDLYTILLASIFLLIKPSPFFTLMKKFSHPKAMFFLVYITFVLPAIIFGNTKYKDWDNAQFIKGLARDFPELVAQIEAETGLDLEVKTDCMITSEKSGNGVNVCQFTYGKNPVSEENLNIAYGVVEKSNDYKKIRAYNNQEGYIYSYRNYDSCEFRSVGHIYASCTFTVREANAGLTNKASNNSSLLDK